MGLIEGTNHVLVMEFVSKKGLDLHKVSVVLFLFRFVLMKKKKTKERECPLRA